MTVVIGIWFALAGGLAALAGLTGIHRTHRLRRRGLAAWATAVPPVAAGAPAGRSPGLALMRYGLADGRVMESFCPEAVWKAALLRPGHKVLVWYDPADPQDVLIHRRRGSAPLTVRSWPSARSSSSSARRWPRSGTESGHRQPMGSCHDRWVRSTS